MARGPVCTFCDEKLHAGDAFCEKCGHPTQWATHDERVLWELGQWETSRATKVEASPRENRAAVSAARTQALAETVRTKAARGAAEPVRANGAEPDSPARRSLASRFRRVAPPDAAPAAQVPAARTPAPAPAPAPAKPAAIAKPAPIAAPGTSPVAARVTTNPPARSAPAAGRTPPTAPPTREARPAATTTQRHAASATRVATKPQSAPAARNTHPRTVAASSAATAPAIVSEPEAVPVERPVAPLREVAPAAPDMPLVIMRKSTTAPARPGSGANGSAVKAPTLAPPVKTGRDPETKKKSKKVKATKPAPAPKPEKTKDRRKDAEKRERKHRRHSKRVNRRAASLDLKEGERVSLSIEGWSRFRRATLVVTNYRVALITRVPPQVRWIPLEEVSTVSRRWHGAWSIMVAAPTEVLTLQKAKAQMLASFQELLDSEVREARALGGQRHHADITQEWCDRATMVWDSRFHRFRLWVRRHPVVNVFAFAACVAGTYYLTMVLTSVFSPVR